MNKTHEPVLLEEVIKSLFPQERDTHIKNQGRYISKLEKPKLFIDCTLGAGGYTKAILAEGGVVLGIDADESMIQIASENLKGLNAKIVNGNFSNLKKIALENGFNEVDGIVFDLGVSNVHFSDEVRGFSFTYPEALLDMRLDRKSNSVKASDLLNMLREDQLKEMFGGKLAHKIVEFRKVNRFNTVHDFLSLFPEKRPGERIHPATTAFMQLRIAVNSELDNLREALPQAYELLKPGGRLVVVSFHSLEDRIVKNFAKEFGGSEPIKPTVEEVNRNPKSRSAILRVIEK